MSIEKNMEKLLAARPKQVTDKLGSATKVCIVSSGPVFRALKDDKVIIMACNTRIKHVIPGILRAAQDLDAIVAFELAKSEGNLKGGYTGMNPQTYFDVVVEYAEQVGITKPFFIHGDHVTTKSTDPDVIADSRALIQAELAAGYTSIAIDASFNHIPENIIVTTDLARDVLAAGAGLEVEVGEIKSAGYDGDITTVAESVDYIKGLADNGIKPHLLAINNGSKHGNYNPGEDVHIDLARTGEIYDAIKPYGVNIAQHGITGTPLDLVGQFADYGIRKGNVGTNWQNIAHAGLPDDLMKAMRDWAAAEGKDIKFATKQFYDEINGIPKEYRMKIEDDSYRSACEFIKAFRADGTATTFLQKMA